MLHNFSFSLQVQRSDRKKKDNLIFTVCFGVDANDNGDDVDTKIQRRVHLIGFKDTFENQGKIFTMTSRKEILFEKPLKMSQHISFPLGHTCRNMDTLYAVAPTP